ncbi:cytochrome c biogenesis CcdA family protein [Aneurinibacillus sp. Ricciae_BoGa-3]|uniref:cytochrome c biogenesis CcdA family protein n=1 Tax=Aneurinibacillus sp. Ricciae_BoGa-3 TaxID=3022697 RepID=UPI003FA41160
MSLIFSFTAGVFSFFSPCIFPLIPAYVAHLTGEYMKEGHIDVQRKVLMIRSMSFILGFSVVFVLMGASASMIGQLFRDNRDLIAKNQRDFNYCFRFTDGEYFTASFFNVRKAMGNKGGKTKNDRKLLPAGSCLWLRMDTLCRAGLIFDSFTGRFIRNDV